MYERRVPVLAVFEGWDAAGKGGAIKRVTATLEPRWVHRLLLLGAPWQGEDAITANCGFSGGPFPARGISGIFDCSYYGRVLVERVEGFCSEAEWKRAYREINEFEEHQAAPSGMVVR